MYNVICAEYGLFVCHAACVCNNTNTICITMNSFAQESTGLIYSDYYAAEKKYPSQMGPLRDQKFIDSSETERKRYDYRFAHSFADNCTLCTVCRYLVRLVRSVQLHHGTFAAKFASVCRQSTAQTPNTLGSLQLSQTI